MNVLSKNRVPGPKCPDKEDLELVERVHSGHAGGDGGVHGVLGARHAHAPCIERGDERHQHLRLHRQPPQTRQEIRRHCHSNVFFQI